MFPVKKNIYILWAFQVLGNFISKINIQSHKNLLHSYYMQYGKPWYPKHIFWERALFVSNLFKEKLIQRRKIIFTILDTLYNYLF